MFPEGRLFEVSVIELTSLLLLVVRFCGRQQTWFSLRLGPLRGPGPSPLTHSPACGGH